MQYISVVSLFFLLLTGAPAFADDHQGNAMSHDVMKVTQQGSGQAMPLTDGIVKKVDHKDGKITLQHAEIANINMPAMTMNYRVEQANQLESLHVGDKVRFAVGKLNNDYIVTHIEVVN